LKRRPKSAVDLGVIDRKNPLERGSAVRVRRGVLAHAGSTGLVTEEETKALAELGRGR